MRYQYTEPSAFGLLAGLAVLLLAALALACGEGCVSYSRLEPQPRLMARQSETAVAIELMCIDHDPFSDMAPPDIQGAHGSGVIIDARHVLTALHVVDCPYLADVHVVLPNGHRQRMIIEKVWRSHDVARLEIATALDTFGEVAPPPIRRMSLDERGTGVCASASRPKVEGTCGQVEHVTDSICAEGHNGRKWCRDMELTMTIVSGNSGSPIYDTFGNLVGLVTGAQYDANGPTGTAYGHSLPGDVMP